MKRRKAVIFLALFIVVGIWTFFFIHLRTQTTRSGTPVVSSRSQSTLPTQDIKRNNRTHSEDPWYVWLEEQTDICVELALEVSSAPWTDKEVAELRNQIRTALKAHAEELRKTAETPPPLNHTKPEISQTYSATGKIYSGPQTSEAIIETLYGIYGSETSRREQDNLYPPEPWLQMILDKGITINNYSEFSGYMAIRASLAQVRTDIENNPSRAEFHAVLYNLPNPTEDWEAFEAAYIEKKIAENQVLNDAMRNNPNVTGGFFTGENLETFLPFTANRVYVRKGETGATFSGKKLSATQKFNLLFRGIEPDGYEITYIDGDGHPLSEKPPLFKREDFRRMQEDFLKNGGELPPNNEMWKNIWQETPSTDASTEASTTEKRMSDFAEQAEVEAKALREQGAKALQKVEEYAIMTDAEIETDIEKQLTQHLPEVPTSESFQTDLQKHLNPKRLNQVMHLLKRYGPKEGLRRLKESDPEGAVLVERILREKQETNE